MTMTEGEASTKTEQLKETHIYYSYQIPFFFKRP
jgi:hypothetical protein